MSRSFMYGLEALDDSGNDPDDTEVTDEILTETQISALEDETEIKDIESEIVMMERDERDFEMSVLQLKKLQSGIEQFGLCKPMIAVLVDEEGLLHSSGLIPAFEELNDIPTQSEDSVEAAKSIGKRIKEVWESVIKFLKNMWAKVKEFFLRFFNMFRKYETIIKGFQKRISDGKYDEKKLAERKFNSLKDSDAEKLIKGMFALSKAANAGVAASFGTAVNKYITDITSMLKSNQDNDTVKAAKEKIEEGYSDYLKVLDVLDKDATGIEVKKEDGKYVGFSSSSPKILGEKKEMTFKEAGINGSDIKDALAQAGQAVMNIKIAQSNIKTLDVQFSSLESCIKSLIARAQKDDKSVTVYESAINTAKRILDTRRAVLNREIANTNAVVKMILSMVQASMPALEKK